MSHAKILILIIIALLALVPKTIADDNPGDTYKRLIEIEFEFDHNQRHTLFEQGRAYFQPNSSISKCEAVLLLEQSFDKGAFRAKPYLDAIYDNNWASIAALEGNHRAQSIVGEDYTKILFSHESAVFRELPEYFYDKAILYFKSAAKNSPRPTQYISTIKLLEVRMKQVGMTISEETIESKEVICPPRSQNIK